VQWVGAGVVIGAIAVIAVGHADPQPADSGPDATTIDLPGGFGFSDAQ
jgi:hypothetical protein